MGIQKEIKVGLAFSLFFNVCEYCICVCTMFMPCVLKGQKIVSELLEMGLQTVEGDYLDAEN